MTGGGASPRPLWHGRAVALVGILLVAANLRTAVAALSPIFSEIRAEFPVSSIGVGLLGIDPGVFIDKMRQLANGEDLFMGLIKSATFGFLISSISTRQGYYASGGARGVGEATTRAVVQSAVAILIANYIITSLLTDEI